MCPLKHSLGTALSPSLSSVYSYLTYMIGLTMEVEYSGGGVLIFSCLILMHERDTFGGLYDNQVEPRYLVTSEFIVCRFDGPSIACKRGLRVVSGAEAA